MLEVRIGNINVLNLWLDRNQSLGGHVGLTKMELIGLQIPGFSTGGLIHVQLISWQNGFRVEATKLDFLVSKSNNHVVNITVFLDLPQETVVNMLINIIWCNTNKSIVFGLIVKGGIRRFS